MRPPRMSIRRWMIAVALIALGLYRVELGILLLVAALAFAAVLCLVNAPAGSLVRRWSLSYLVTIACLYFPYSWLALLVFDDLRNSTGWLDFRWDSYHWTWVTMWPVLPGFTAGMFVHPNDAAMLLVMALATVLLIALFTWLGSGGRMTFIVASALALIGSGIQSWFSYVIYLF